MPTAIAVAVFLLAHVLFSCATTPPISASPWTGEDKVSAAGHRRYRRGSRH